MTTSRGAVRLGTRRERPSTPFEPELVLAAHQADELRVGGEVVEGEVDELSHRLQWRQGAEVGGAPARRAASRRTRAPGRRGKALLAAEVVVDQPKVDLRVGDDALDAAAAKPLLGELADRAARIRSRVCGASPPLCRGLPVLPLRRFVFSPCRIVVAALLRGDGGLLHDAGEAQAVLAQGGAKLLRGGGDRIEALGRMFSALAGFFSAATIWPLAAARSSPEFRRGPMIA